MRQLTLQVKAAASSAESHELQAALLAAVVTLHARWGSYVSNDGLGGANLGRKQEKMLS